MGAPAQQGDEAERGDDAHDASVSARGDAGYRTSATKLGLDPLPTIQSRTI